MAKGHRHDHPGRRRIHDGQHAVVEREASQRVRQRREERRQQQKRISGKQRRVDRTAEAEGLRQGALREIVAATIIQRPSVGGAQQGVAIGKVEGGEGPAGVLQSRTVERIDQPGGGDGGCRLLGGRAGASAIGVAEDQHDAATEAARHGLGGKLRDRVLLLARQQRQQIGPDGKAGHAQDRQVDGGRGDDREPERRQDARHGRLAVSSSSLASASERRARWRLLAELDAVPVAVGAHHLDRIDVAAAAHHDMTQRQAVIAGAQRRQRHRPGLVGALAPDIEDRGKLLPVAAQRRAEDLVQPHDRRQPGRRIVRRGAADDALDDAARSHCRDQGERRLGAPQHAAPGSEDERAGAGQGCVEALQETLLREAAAQDLAAGQGQGLRLADCRALDQRRRESSAEHLPARDHRRLRTQAISSGGEFERHLAGCDRNRDLHGAAFGQDLARGGIEHPIVYADPVLVLPECRAHGEFLGEPQRADILDRQVDDRPGEARRLHRPVAEADLVEQRGARLLEVAEVVAVPDDVHRIEVVELRPTRHFCADHGGTVEPDGRQKS